MTRFEIRTDWGTPNDLDDALPLERATWAKISIFLDDQCLTLNHPADYKTDEGDVEYVVGPASGLAEWLVDSWRHLLWETHTPFPKLSSDGGATSHCIPGLREAMGAWSEWTRGDVDIAEMGRWQARHTMGAADTWIALPSLTILPEVRNVGIVVDHPPTYELDSTIRFSPPDSDGHWPTDLLWVPKDEFEGSARAFVEGVLARASDPQWEESVGTWARWLHKRWQDELKASVDEDVRRQVLYGDFVSERWNDLAANLGEDIKALEDFLTDIPIIKEENGLAALLEEIRELNASRPVPSGKWDWKENASMATRGRDAPYHQGYRLASLVRSHIGNEKEPIADLRDLLDGFGVLVKAVHSKGQYRSAALCASSGQAKLLYSVDHPRFGGVAPTRFALAAAFGRLLTDGFASLTRQSSFAAAQSEQSRWLESQRANAFAAELLLPATAIGSQDLADLSESFGISRSAAKWHKHNRMAEA